MAAGSRPPTLQRIFTHVGLLTRAMTLGVRAVVLDDAQRVLLVKHTYTPGWYLPGGGVEPGETMLGALTREVDEEGGVVVEEPPRLFGMYLNRRVSRRDHVALFVVGRFTLRPAFQAPPREIVEARFCALGELPPDTTAATHRRLAEVLHGAPVDQEW